MDANVGAVCVVVVDDKPSTADKKEVVRKDQTTVYNTLEQVAPHRVVQLLRST